MKNTSKGILILNSWFDLMIDELTPQQTIEILKLIRAEKNGESYETSDEFVKIHWFHMKHNVKSSIEKYEDLCKRRSEYGKRGGAPYGNKNSSKNNQNNQKQPKQAMDKEKDKDKENPYPSDKGDSITSLGDVISSRQNQLSVETLFNL